MDVDTLTAALKLQAQQLGFSLVGVTPAVTPTGFSRFAEWLARGYAGRMAYLERRRDAYEHPDQVLDGARSLVVLAMDYQTQAPRPVPPGQGRVSRYAWGEADYHDVIRQRLHQLADWLRERVPEARTRGVVDTAPLLERDFAVLAGLGWQGKHTLVINRQRGSWFFLAVLLTDAELAYDTQPATDHCGSCRACLDACPTDAFPQPYVLDARRCISYLTIELRGAIPAELRPAIGDWLFGCDICQEVCPWNRKAPTTDLADYQPQADRNPADLVELLEMDDARFRARFRHMPLWRAGRRGILRNAAIVLGNQRYLPAVPALLRCLSDDEPWVRGAAAWALAQMPSQPVRQALEQRLNDESDPDVRQELEAALGKIAGVPNE